MDNTVLRISGVALPPYAARGIEMTLAVIGEAANLRRTVNGALQDVSDPLFRKYAVSLNCTDQQPPAIDDVWPGMTVTLHSIVEIASNEQPTEITELATELEETEPSTEAAGVFGRPAVPGSVRQESGYWFYRPILTMLITDFSVDRDEWGAAVGWQMTLEEV